MHLAQRRVISTMSRLPGKTCRVRQGPGDFLRITQWKQQGTISLYLLRLGKTYGFAGMPGIFKRALVYPDHCHLKVHASCSHDLSCSKQEHSHSAASPLERGKGTTDPRKQIRPSGLRGLCNCLVWRDFGYHRLSSLCTGLASWKDSMASAMIHVWGLSVAFQVTLAPASRPGPWHSQTLPDCVIPTHWGRSTWSYGLSSPHRCLFSPDLTI